MSPESQPRQVLKLIGVCLTCVALAVIFARLIQAVS